MLHNRCMPTSSPCAGCSALDLPTTTTVTLLGGQVVCNTCPSWREECRERAEDVYRVLALPDKDARHSYLDAYGQDRGPAALERLKAAVLQMHALRRRQREEEEARAAGGHAVGDV
jgi:hypothetical protein